MQTILASEFKSKCLKIMDEVAASGEEVVVTKPLLRWREELLAAGLRELPVDGRLGIEAAELPNFHGDPADRIIVASALVAGCSLVTADHQILAWPGSIEVIDARR